MLDEKVTELLLEGNLAMMFGLISNIDFHQINVWLANGKGAVAALPAESGEVRCLCFESFGRGFFTFSTTTERTIVRWREKRMWI